LYLYRRDIQCDSLGDEMTEWKDFVESLPPELVPVAEAYQMLREYSASSDLSYNQTLMTERAMSALESILGIQ